MRRFGRMQFCAAACLALLSGAVIAQGSADAYPSRPAAVIVPNPPGGPTDIEARLFAAKMTDLMGQPFVVDYKAGAGTTVGSGYVAKSTPDGHTLLVVTGAFTSFPAFYKDLPFDTIKDFAPITLMSQRANVLVVSASFPAKNFAEYLAYARANPERINFGTSGGGGGIHLAGAWLHSATNTKVTFIHYKGTGAFVQDLLAGRLQATSLGMLVSLPLLKAGKVRAIAILNDARSKLLPDLPTVSELSIPGYNYSAWLGFAAPAATPAGIVNKLADGFVRIARSPDVVSRMEAEGSMMVGNTPAQFAQYLIKETAQWRKVVQENGITAEE